jgi:hypothetical protein
MLIISGQQAEIQIPDSRVPPAPKANATTSTSTAAVGVTIQLLPTAGPHGEVQASLIVSQSSPMESKAITNALPNTVAKDIHDLVPVPGQPIHTLPKFRVHQNVQQVNIPAGHSALVTIHSETSGKQPNGQPATEFKVLLTPTLIEPAGHRIHTDEVMPFAPAVPAKK